MTLLIALFVIIILFRSTPAFGTMGSLFAGKDKTTARQDVVTEIARTMRTHGITTAEIETALQSIPELPEASSRIMRSGGEIARTIFSWLGGIFILAGIVVYIGTFWSSMGSFMHIFVTLGVGFMLAGVFLLSLHEGKFPKLVMPLSLAQAIMQTTGWFVTINEIFPHGNDVRKAAVVVFAIMAAQQAFIFARHRLTIIALYALIFFYGFMQEALDLAGFAEYAIAIILGASLIIVAQALEKTAQRSLSVFGFLVGALWFNAGLYDFTSYHYSSSWAGLLTGISGMLLAYGLQLEKRYPRLIELGYLLGSSFFYAGLFDMVRHTHAELLFLGVAVSMLYVCMLLHSRTLLVTAIIAILGFISYYTEEYFVNSIGWPIALIIMGVMFLGVGVLAFKVKKKL